MTPQELRHLHTVVSSPDLFGAIQTALFEELIKKNETLLKEAGAGNRDECLKLATEIRVLKDGVPKLLKRLAEKA